MQTFRECSRILQIDLNQGPFTCANPLSFADLVLSVGDPQAGVMQKAGANRGVSFAGAHGEGIYGMQICPGSTSLPAGLLFYVRSALMVLPLQEGSYVAPLIIPNISASRSQLSVVQATQSDSERRILWYRSDKLFWANVFANSGFSGCDTQQTVSTTTMFNFELSLAAIMFGRTPPDAAAFRVKARARMTEREGLFLVRNIVTSANTTLSGVLSISSDFYLRFAVK